MKKLCLTILLLALAASLSAKETFRFAQRDTCDLYLDIHAPAVDTAGAPTVLFVFGGGFITGSRNDKFYDPWFRKLNENGFRVVSIDYRLGLKGQKMRFDLFHLLESARLTKKAVDMGVEDVFDAVRFLGAHAQELGVDMDKIIIAGSSAGAMISLSAEWEVSKGNGPEGFRFAGVMSFAGAIMSDSGVPAYPEEPCPQLLFHGTKDGAVAYDKMAFGRWGMFGSNQVAKVLGKRGAPYCIYRFKDHSHDMASNFMATWPEQERFLRENVLGGVRRTVDAMVDDPAVPVWQSVTLDDIY